MTPHAEKVRMGFMLIFSHLDWILNIALLLTLRIQVQVYTTCVQVCITCTGYCECTSRRTVVSDGSDWTVLIFRVRCTSFHNHSPLLTFFLCFIVLFQSCCSHARVFCKHSCMSSPFSIAILKGTCSLQAPILICCDVPAINN